MKVIFLDVDGVLNSCEYFEAHGQDPDLSTAIIDPNSIDSLERIVRETGARIILTSSWREGWDPDPDKTQPSVSFLNEILEKRGITILDKTPSFHTGKRAEEILHSLRCRKERIDSFVILDDTDYHWDRYRLGKRWVETDFLSGGLTKQHADRAIRILQKTLHWKERMRLRFCFFLK